MGAHGTVVHDPVVRVHTASGAVGLGWSRLERSAAESLVGRRLGEAVPAAGRIAGEGSAIDLPLWELAIRLRGVPLYRLLGGRGSRAVELYHGSIYIDDPDAGDAQAPHPARGGRPRHQDQWWTPTTGELVFCDALETNDSAVHLLGDETLREMARELVDTVRRNVTIDWTLRENVRANPA